MNYRVFRNRNAPRHSLTAVMSRDLLTPLVPPLEKGTGSPLLKAPTSLSIPWIAGTTANRHESVCKGHQARL